MTRTPALLALLLTLPAWAGEIVLRASVRVDPARPVTLADAAVLKGEDAQALGDRVLIADPAAEAAARRWITLDADRVRAALDEGGANWARLTLRGRDVTLVLEAPERAPAPAPAAPAAEDAAHAGPTLRDAVERRITQLFAVAPDDLRLTFDPRDAALLRTPTAGRVVDVQPVGASDRLPMRVTVYEGQRIVLSEGLRVEVRVRRVTAVLRRGIERGQRLTLDDLAETEQWLPPGDDAATLDEATSAAARARLEPGATLRRSDLEPPVLIQRGDRVSLHAIVGRIVLRTEARALRDARDGETVELEALDGSRKRYIATVSGPGRAVMNTNASTLSLHGG